MKILTIKNNWLNIDSFMATPINLLVLLFLILVLLRQIMSHLFEKCGKPKTLTILFASGIKDNFICYNKNYFKL